MVKVKICGITHEDEIDYLNEFKPDYAGFVFAESKRNINIEKAEKLCLKLTETIKSVGVFRNQSIDEIINVSNKVKLNVIQLHGNEDIKYIKTLKNSILSDIEIWKAISINEIENINRLINEKYEYIDITRKCQKRNLIDKYLIDGLNPGSGQEYCLKKLTEHINSMPQEFNFFLAGGINPDNVCYKLNAVHPFGIDVSSGVEYVDENGVRKKSYEKIKLLIKRAKK